MLCWVQSEFYSSFNPLRTSVNPRFVDHWVPYFYVRLFGHSETIDWAAGKPTMREANFNRNSDGNFAFLSHVTTASLTSSFNFVLALVIHALRRYNSPSLCFSYNTKPLTKISYNWDWLPFVFNRFDVFNPFEPNSFTPIWIVKTIFFSS